MSTIKLTKWQTPNATTHNSVLQIQSYSYNTQETFNCTSDADPRDTQFIGFIKPMYANSKILVIASCPVFWSYDQTVCRIRLRRIDYSSYTSGGVIDPTISPAGQSTGGYTNWTNVTYAGSGSGVSMTPNTEVTWYDTAGTLSNIGYRVQLSGNSSNTSYTFGLNRYSYGADWSGVSHMTIMEIQQ